MGGKKAIKYPGDNVDVYWSGRLCIHVGECGRAKGELFTTGRKPWCDPNLATDDEVEDVVKRCPTGALHYMFRDGSGAEKADAENTIHVAYNGPLYVRGDLLIDAAPDSVPGLAFRAALCRCGHSKNKPFCDNSHEKAEFKDYGAVGDGGSKLEDSGGELKVSPLPDGPLLVKGNVRISSGSGRTAWEGTQVALCRCGASANKPFCDGAHTRVGFKSEERSQD